MLPWLRVSAGGPRAFLLKDLADLAWKSFADLSRKSWRICLGGPLQSPMEQPLPALSWRDFTMARIINSQIERLKRAAPHPTDVWQGGIFRMPAWITGEKGSPYRALLPVWVSAETGAAFPGDMMRPEELDPARALDAVARASLRSPFGGYRPAGLEVTDPSLAEYLRDAVSDLGIEVSQVERLEHVDKFLRAMAEDTAGPISMCAALAARGVTVERMGAFADAAADFYRAGLWNHLANQDLIRIESSVPDPDLSHLVVMGAAGEVYGIAFFSSMEKFEAMIEAHDRRDLLESSTVWGLDYGPIMGIPFPDADLWEDHGLSVAGADAYPCFFCKEPGELFRRPDAQTLTFIEALLRALAQTAEDELDSGRWTKNVATFDGKVKVTLALPGILDPRPIDTTGLGSGFPDRRGMEKTLRAFGQMLEDKDFDSVDKVNSLIDRELADKPSPEFKIRSPREKALDLFYQAIDAEGRLQIKLARQALAIDPDCADAYVLLAERMPDPERRLALYRKGMEAGEHAIGKKAFEEDAGRFWGILETRPYMRARAGLAECLRSSGRTDEAIEDYRELLRLNPDDSQGIRFVLIPLLLEHELDAEAEWLLDAYTEDISASIAYARALLSFRKEGDSADARKHLDLAVKRNPHMVKLILGGREIPEVTSEHYTLGSKEEAIAYAPDALPAWRKTSGAVAWVKSWRRGRKKAAAGKRKPQRKVAGPGKRGRGRRR